MPSAPIIPIFQELHTLLEHEVLIVHLDLVNAGRKDAEVVIMPANVKCVIPKKSSMHIGPFAVTGPATLGVILVKDAEDLGVLSHVHNTAGHVILI